MLWLVNDVHLLAPYVSMIKYGDAMDVRILLDFGAGDDL